VVVNQKAAAGYLPKRGVDAFEFAVRQFGYPKRAPVQLFF